MLNLAFVRTPRNFTYFASPVPVFCTMSTMNQQSTLHLISEWRMLPFVQILTFFFGKTASGKSENRRHQNGTRAHDQRQQSWQKSKLTTQAPVSYGSANTSSSLHFKINILLSRRCRNAGGAPTPTSLPGSTARLTRRGHDHEDIVLPLLVQR